MGQDQKYDMDALFGDSVNRDEYWIELAKLDFTEEICRRMEKIGCNRKELADKIGVSPAYITKILRGNANFTIESMTKISRALGAALRCHIQSEGEVFTWFAMEESQEDAAFDLLKEREKYSQVDCSDITGDENADFAATA